MLLIIMVSPDSSPRSPLQEVLPVLEVVYSGGHWVHVGSGEPAVGV